MSTAAQDWPEELRQYLFALDHVLARGPVGVRSLRLACVELASRLVPDPDGEVIKPVAHLGAAVAEGELTLEAAWEQCWNYPGNWRIANTVLVHEQDLAKAIRKVFAFFLDDSDGGAFSILRFIVGNPFRPVVFDPRWRTETAVALAAGIYAERAFDRLPILADALEEAGCDRPDVLAHCRGPDPHARGCWVVDGVLGKQ
jgi:hypothetical protein